MRKKTFKTKLTKEQKRKDILVLLAVMICSDIFLLIFCFSIGVFDDWTDPFVYYFVFFGSFSLLSMLLFPVLIIAIVLGIQKGKARCIREDSSNLDHSESELLNIIKKGKLNDKKALLRWKQSRFREAESLGYIKKKEVSKDYDVGKPLLFFLSGILVAFILWGIFLGLDLYKTRDGTSMIIDFIRMNAYLLVMDAVLFIPAYNLMKDVFSRKRGDVLWERTVLGNETAEKIAGLLRFINDFSILSESEKEEVVLWEDYLVYAIVLDENEKIVREIGKLNKIDDHILRSRT